MRFATFNTLHGRSLVDGRVVADRFVTAVKQLDADVLALQEVDRYQPRSGEQDFAAIAAEAMGAVAHRFVPVMAGDVHALRRTPATSDGDASEGDDGPGYGIALLSRYPMRSWRTIALGRSYVVFPIVLDRRLIWIRDEPRVALAAEIGTPLGPITVVAVHLSFVPVYNGRQLRRLAAAVRGTDPLVVLGDLNMSAAGAERATGLTACARYATYPSHRPRRQLDHVLISAGVEPPAASAAHVLPVSDHCALTADWTA